MSAASVILVEKSASLGGRVARMHQYFPKLCPPACGLEMHYRRLRDNPAITVLTLAEVVGRDGIRGRLRGDGGSPAPLRDRGLHALRRLRATSARRSGRTISTTASRSTKAAYLPHGMAYPALYAIDRAACPAGCKACEEACTYGAIHLRRAARRSRKYNVCAIVAATGWKPYDAAKLDHLGFGKYRNVVTNVMLERMAADGRSHRRPDPAALRRQGAADGGLRAVRRLARREPPALLLRRLLRGFHQARGVHPRAVSGDGNHHLLHRHPHARPAGGVLARACSSDADLRLIKGKVARVEENSATGDLLVTAEDVLAGRKSTQHFELVVLATGIVPQTEGLPAALRRDEFGFLNAPTGPAGSTPRAASAGRRRSPRRCRMPPARP